MIYLGSHVMVRLHSSNADSAAGFGRRVSVAIAVAAIVATLAGMVAVAVSANPPPVLRWGLCVPVAVAAGGVAALAAGAFAREDSSAVTDRIFLSLATVAMSIVAARAAQKCKVRPRRELPCL